MVLTNSHINPPAPKVPRRGSLAVDATGQIYQTGTASAGGGAMFARAPAWYFAHFADRLEIVQMDRFDPTWPQHWPDLGSTLASKAPTSAQLGPIGSNFGPTWLQDGTTWLQLGPI